MAEWILTAIWLLTASVLDVRSRRLPVWLLAAGGVGAVSAAAYSCATASGEWPGMILGCVPGALMLSLAAATKNAGIADGVALIWMGLLLGGNCLTVFAVSLFLIALFSAGMLVFRRVGKKTALPYLPFLFAAWLLAGS